MLLQAKMKSGKIPRSPIIAVTGDDVDDLQSEGIFDGVGRPCLHTTWVVRKPITMLTLQELIHKYSLPLVVNS